MDGLTALSWGAQRIDLFWLDDGRELRHRSWDGWDGTGWSIEESLGGAVDGGFAVTAWARDEMQVFAVFADGELWNRYWDGRAWHPWESLGGELRGQPAASSWSASRIDVFAPGRDGATWHRWWDGSHWVAWEPLPD